MNRTDRLYALVEELRAAGRRGRTARQLATRFEVSVRTVERDLDALGQAGLPLATKQGRGGGYSLDRSVSLPPLNFTAREAAAVAVALSLSEHVLFSRDARSALHKIAAAMPEPALREARAAAEKVRLIVKPGVGLDAGIAETITLAWFEIAVSDPDSAEKFYGSLFGWTFDRDNPASSGGMDYRNISASGAGRPMGGLLGTSGAAPGHAVFYILVADVEAACGDAEQLGGSVVSRHLKAAPGAPAFAYLRDPAGNMFGVFSLPAA